MSDEVKDQGKEVKPEEQKPVKAAPAADGAAAPKAEEKPKEEPAKVEDEYDDEYWDDIEAEEEEEAKKKKIKVILGTIIAVIVIVALAAYIYVGKLGKYNDAVGLYEAGQYGDAAIAFEEVGAFQDAARYAQKSYYEQGGELLVAGDFEAAKAAFEAAGDYDNAADMVVKCDYKQAIALFDGGDAAAAAVIFANLAGYNQADMYLEWANAKAKYADYDVNADVFGDGYADWRAAEAGLGAVVYGTWYNAETGEALEIGTATIGENAYTINAAEGFGVNVTFAGVLANGEAYKADVRPVYVDPVVNELVLNDVVYYNVAPEDFAAIAEAKANGEYAVEGLEAQRFSNNAVVGKALDMFVATTKEAPAEEEAVEVVAPLEEEVVEEAPAEEVVEEEAVAEEVTEEVAPVEEKSFKEKLLALVPAHYTAKDEVVTYDAESKVYTVAFNAVYIENAMSVFKKAECPTYPVEATFIDTGAGLKVIDFAVVAPAEEEAVEEAPAEEVAADEEVAAEEAPAEEVTEEAAPAEEQ
jgi:hypothetical protein